MKKIVFIIAIGLFVQVTAISQSYEWAKSIGSRNIDRGTSIATDRSGNVYITGSYWSTTDFDPSSSTAYLTSAGWSDIFLAKYDASGEYLWAIRIGGASNDFGSGIAIDGSGYVYITGIFNETVDFDPSAAKAKLTSIGRQDIFMAKYDTRGNYVWAKNMGSTTNDFGRGITVDKVGNVYITGGFKGRTDFAPGTKATKLTSAGRVDIFLSKYNSNGTCIWTKGIGGTGDDYGISLSTDNEGNVYVTGKFEGKSDFDPGPENAFLTSGGEADIFFAKYDAQGQYLWAKSIGNVFNDKGAGITTDDNRNVYITGHFYGNADFDPSRSSANLISTGWEDIFFAKYDSNGNYLWAKNIGSATDDAGTSIASDGSGNVYITGYFSISPDFDPGPRTINLSAVSWKDIFLAKYNTEGEFLWAKSFGGKGSDYGNDITYDPSGKIYVTGQFQSTTDFDPGEGSTKLTSNGLADIFFTKYDAGALEIKTKIEKPIVLEKIQKEVKQKEVLLKKALLMQAEEKLSTSKVARNVQTNVKAEVVEKKDEKGETELNLNVKYEYQVIKAVFENQTDDYAAGEYRLSQSNAAKVILSVLKNTVEKELQEYLLPETKVTIKITGSTDASPVTGKIPYKGEYGWFKDEFAFINGMLDNITITKESGITSNEQLAYLRTYGVRSFMENYVSPLRVTNNKFEHYAMVSKKVGAQYRRISIEIIIHKAFDEKNIYAREELAAMRGSGDPLKGLNVSAATSQLELGKYFILIIGIDNYTGAWLPLKNAVKDAKEVENILREKYKVDYVRTLHNELATRTNIIKEFTWLVKNVTEKDNVFIYFSGHGDFKKELNKGYWVPSDAQTTEIYDFISNSDIQTFMSGIKAKHTLLISDACFSGDLFRGSTLSVPFEETSKYYHKVNSLKSRQALTSGGIEPVMDGGREGHSIFTYYMLEMLKRNEMKFYDAGQLYNDLKIPVTNNSDQTPILQPVKNTGDEGGQFIFIKK